MVLMPARLVSHVVLQRLALLWVLVWVRGVRSSIEGIDPSVYFEDTKFIPPGHEVTAYILHNRTNSYTYFLLEKDIPLFITLTPCASRIEWTVTQKPMSETDSDDGSDLSRMQTTVMAPHVLHSYTGRERSTMRERGASFRRIFSVQVRAIDSDTRVSFYANKGDPSTDNRYPYPQLPQNTRLQEEYNRRRRFSVRWNRSPDDTPFDSIVDYCVAVSVHRTYRTDCALQAFMHGDSVIRPPTGSGWNSVDKTEKFNEFLSQAQPVKPDRKNFIFYKCPISGSVTSFSFDKAKSGTKYFINVFVRNKNTNKTSAYSELVIKTKKRKKNKKIKDENINTVSLQKKRQKSRLRYRLMSPARQLHLTVQSCSGVVKIQVIKSRRKLVNARVHGLKTFSIRRPRAGAYNIKIVNMRKGARNVKIFVTKRKKFVEPPPPERAVVAIVGNSTTCSNATITWTMRGNRKTFCFYRTEVTQRASRRREKLDICGVPKSIDSGETSVADSSTEDGHCRKVRVRGDQPEEGELEHTFTDLKPDTFYKFDVVERRKSGLTVLYSGVTHRTHKDC